MTVPEAPSLARLCLAGIQKESYSDSEQTAGDNGQGSMLGSSQPGSWVHSPLALPLWIAQCYLLGLDESANRSNMGLEGGDISLGKLPPG